MQKQNNIVANIRNSQGIGQAKMFSEEKDAVSWIEERLKEQKELYKMQGLHWNAKSATGEISILYTLED